MLHKPLSPEEHARELELRKHRQNKHEVLERMKKRFPHISEQELLEEIEEHMG